MFKTLKRNFFPFIIAFSALSVSASAAFYSVSGLSKLFAGASFEVIIMAGSLEIAKLVIASLLYQYWDSINKWLRAYLSIATIILVLITSMGIYGFLSAAYQETYSKLLIQENEIEFIENKAQFYEADLVRYDTELARISENINILSNAKASGIQVRDTSSTTGFRQTISTTELRMAQKRIEVEEANRKEVQVKRQVAADSVQTFRLEILGLQNTSETAGELGPLQYLSGLTGTPMDKIINWLLLIIIFVFDPLAISLVVAANFAFDQAKNEDEDDTEYTPRDSVFNDMDIDGWEDEIDPPNDELVNAAERYKEEVGYAEDILDDFVHNPSTNAMDVSMDKENAKAWGQLADELARGAEEETDEENVNAWIDDPDVQDFLEHVDEQGPWSEEDDQIHTVGGLTNDEDGNFMDFQDQMDENDMAVDRHEPEEEWDEEHALDQVLNDMVADMTPEEINEIANSKFEVEDTYGNIEVIDPKEVQPDGSESEFPNENNPTSVAAVVKNIPNDFGTYPSTVQKIETPHLPETTEAPLQKVTKNTTIEVDATTTEAPIDEDQLFDDAMRAQAEKDMIEYLRNKDADSKK
jgi:hypothetical protein